MSEKKDGISDRCWVDGSVHCPYGSPEGQYIHRPKGFCADGVCLVYREQVEEPEMTQRLKDRAVIVHFNTHRTSLADELTAIADLLPEISTEYGIPKKTLEEAAGILVMIKMNADILVGEDLPFE